MYVPKINENTNLEEVRDFIHQNSFGILVTQLENKPVATHIPIELSKNTNGKDVLIGHISRGNEQWKTFENNENALAIFSSPHSYVSSSWYQHAVTVPTWNYIAIHVYGKIRVLSKEELHQSLIELVNKYETISKNPLHLNDLPAEKVKREMRGIIGFEMEITNIQARYKLSQNRNTEDQQHVIRELKKLDDNGAHYIADEMDKRR